MRIPRHFGARGPQFQQLEFKPALGVRELKMLLRLGEFHGPPMPIRIESMLLNSDIFCIDGYLSPGRVEEIAQPHRPTPPYLAQIAISIL